MATGACGKIAENQKGDSLNLANRDTTILPGNDFYDYATGGWQRSNPLKPEFARFGTFDQLRENNKEQVRLLIENLSKSAHPAGSLEKKIADLYNTGMDSIRLNAEGVSPLKLGLESIDAIKSQDELSHMIGRLNRRSVFPFFAFYVDADPKSSSMNLLQTYQAGMGMGQRDYYLDQDEHTVNIRNAYHLYIQKLFILLGKTESEATEMANHILQLETALAEAAYTQEQLRDPLQNYNKMSIEEFKQRFDGINWDNLLTSNELAAAKSINVSQIPFMIRVNEILKTTPLEQLKHYVAFNLINESCEYLSDPFSDASFEFYGKAMTGVQERQPRWKRVLSSVDAALGEAVGQLYVEQYFPETSKHRMLDLVANLQEALGERIRDLDWMSSVTKEEAVKKLNTFVVKIGYPDKWRDYSLLEVNAETSYLGNLDRSRTFEWDYMIGQNEQPVDKSKWHMNPQTVNAYYNPSSNEICFPAAILQPPFFYPEGDDAINYGAIGVVIGHEMTHGFDDQGRQFDKDGNIHDWWSAEDAVQFKQRTDKLVAQFDSIKVLGDLHANGRFTLGENIADQGGLVVSHLAMQNALAKAGTMDQTIDGLTQNQRFLLAYANIWAGNIRDEEIVRLTKIDPHSLGRWRVNGTLPNLDIFYEAFPVIEGSLMYRRPNERVVIW